MLTEPDMQARYAATLLDVLATDLPAIGAPASQRATASAAAREARRLADALAPHSNTVTSSTPALDNVLLFRKRA